MLTLFVAIAVAQSGGVELRCSGLGSVRTCSGSDGSTYVERVVGNRIIRQATGPDGETWTEYVLTEASGTRTLGQDSSGRTWAQTCSPQFGTRGIDRSGQAIYRPPQRLSDDQAAADEATTSGYAPCPDTVADYDAERQAVAGLSAREIEQRDSRRRRRRRGF